MGEPNKVEASDTITRVAQFECTQSRWEKTWRPYGMEGETESREIISVSPDEAPVTIQVIPNETQRETEKRFRQAAEIESRGLVFRGECSSAFFKRFLPTAQEALTQARSSVFSDLLTAYANSMDTCRQTLGSFVLCKPQP